MMAHVRLCKDYIKGVRESIEARGKIADGDNHSEESSILLDALLNEVTWISKTPSGCHNF